MDSLFSPSLFPDLAPPGPAAQKLPPGFGYWRDFLTLEEERRLLAEIATLELRPSQYHEYTALRKTASFSLRGGPVPVVSFSGPLAERRLGSREGVAFEAKPSAPAGLRWLAEKVARHVGRDPRDFPHALVTEYPPGAPIGWHRDAPPFAAIYGVSLASDCTFRLRPHVAAEDKSAAAADARSAVVKLTAERRSLYAMTGPSRSSWQHSIPPVKQLRHSITLRTL
jgi:alkylated DNA repair dioxygenase AlkB